MSYVIRNIRPSIIHIPDAGLRLDSGETAIVDTLSPQMDELLANRALEAISSDPDPPVATIPVEEDSVVAEVTPVPEESTPDDVVSVMPDMTIVDATAPVVPEKKTRKASATPGPEQPDGTQ